MSGSRGPGAVLAALLLGVLVLLASCSTTPATADAPARQAPRVVSGQVVARTATSWTVQPAGGAPLTITVTPGTAFGRKHQPETPDRFPVGSAVRVSAVERDGTLVARRVAPPLDAPAPGAPAAPQAGATPSPTTPAPTAPAAPPPAAPAPGPLDPSAAGAVAARHPGVDVGVAAAPVAGGPATLGPGGDTPFETASVVKLYTVVDILHRAETGAGTVSDADRDDIRRALSASDDSAMDELWETHGGADTVTDVVTLAGLQDTAPPDDPGEWGLATTSARDVVAVWRYALTALSPADRDLVVGATSSSTAAGADGFDQSFGLLADPRPAGVEAKQGWMSDGDLYLHTTGLPSAGSTEVVAVLTRQPSSQSWDEARAVVNEVTSAVTGTQQP